MSNAEHRQLQVTGQVQYIAGGGGGVHAVFHRCRYVYINFEVIISITEFFIDDSLGPLARESPCINIVQHAGSEI